jgi:hypothetical protein
VRSNLIMRLGRTVALAASATWFLVVPGAGVSNAAAPPPDPSPYCRPLVNPPVVNSATDNGNGTYDVVSSVTVVLTCNGPIYKGQITALFHYVTSPASIGSAHSGIVTGNSVSCSGTCSASARFRRTLFCNSLYSFSDAGQITGFWQQTSSSAKNNISVLATPTAGGADEIC